MLLYNIKELYLMYIEYFKTKLNVNDVYIKPLRLSKKLEIY